VQNDQIGASSMVGLQLMTIAHIGGSRVQAADRQVTQSE